MPIYVGQQGRMNQNDDSKNALAYNTADLEDAVTIAAILYVDWRDYCDDLTRNPGGPTHLVPFGDGRFLKQPGYPSEPKSTFCGATILISTMARKALGIEKRAGPVLRCIARRLVDRDGEEFNETLGDIADLVAQLIDLQHEENSGRWAA